MRLMDSCIWHKHTADYPTPFQNHLWNKMWPHSAPPPRPRARKVIENPNNELQHHSCRLKWTKQLLKTTKPIFFAESQFTLRNNIHCTLSHTPRPQTKLHAPRFVHIHTHEKNAFVRVMRFRHVATTKCLGFYLYDEFPLNIVFYFKTHSNTHTVKRNNHLIFRTCAISKMNTAAKTSRDESHASHQSGSKWHVHGNE